MLLLSQHFRERPVRCRVGQSSELLLTHCFNVGDRLFPAAPSAGLPPRGEERHETKNILGSVVLTLLAVGAASRFCGEEPGPGLSGPQSRDKLFLLLRGCCSSPGTQLRRFGSFFSHSCSKLLCCDVTSAEVRGCLRHCNKGCWLLC